LTFPQFVIYIIAILPEIKTILGLNWREEFHKLGLHFLPSYSDLLSITTSLCFQRTVLVALPVAINKHWCWTNEKVFLKFKNID